VPGTNLAAVRCRAVDILAHPGLLTPDEAHYAAENGVFLELSARRGHCLANGHIVQVARAAGALLLVDSDGHAPGDLLSADFAQRVARGAGLTPAEAATVLTENPQRLLARGYSLCWHVEGRRLVRTVAQVGPGDRLLIQVADGQIPARVSPDDQPATGGANDRRNPTE